MTDLEQSLQTLLASLVERETAQISVTQLLSEQGVDSLIGLRFARKIQDLTGREVELEWLYDYPTIRQLANFLSASGSAS